MITKRIIIIDFFGRASFISERLSRMATAETGGLCRYDMA